MLRLVLLTIAISACSQSVSAGDAGSACVEHFDAQSQDGVRFHTNPPATCGRDDQLGTTDGGAVLGGSD